MPASEAIAAICPIFGLSPAQAANAGIFALPVLAAVRGHDIDSATLTQLAMRFRIEQPDGSLESFLSGHDYYFSLDDF